uniref:C2H2-type domain-containing protein n=1 Tax=Anabas testudineus TaxID=64144 RepID=A0A7N6FK10_ANATE
MVSSSVSVDQVATAVCPQVKNSTALGVTIKLQAALQHLQRPVKKPPSALANSATTALSATHAQVVNFNRLPSTSKAAASALLSVQRVHLGDKQSAALNRASAPWVSVKTHHQHLLRCGQCGKCFPHPSNLKAHLQTHTGERPFCCSLCGRSFTKLSNLKAHRRVHTGERPYCCLACGKRFTQKCNLKRHQRIHLDV